MKNTLYILLSFLLACNSSSDKDSKNHFTPSSNMQSDASYYSNIQSIKGGDFLIFDAMGGHTYQIIGEHKKDLGTLIDDKRDLYLNLLTSVINDSIVFRLNHNFVGLFNINTEEYIETYNIDEFYKKTSLDVNNYSVQHFGAMFNYGGISSKGVFDYHNDRAIFPIRPKTGTETLRGIPYKGNFLAYYDVDKKEGAILDFKYPYNYEGFWDDWSAVSNPYLTTAGQNVIISFPFTNDCFVYSMENNSYKNLQKESSFVSRNKIEEDPRDRDHKWMRNEYYLPIYFNEKNNKYYRVHLLETEDDEDIYNRRSELLVYDKSFNLLETVDIPEYVKPTFLFPCEDRVDFLSNNEEYGEFVSFHF
ncbi:DUF4221 family protein [Flammeovirga sp. OC4]|uniref:DUF4221 family protein n=1 Tax=Flammeovirga sp. OC4 TaxID=1382345 RepID=UPI0005C7072D|nr:DUF4221 family protein [Flammeovirga sp. OC4]